MNINIKNYIYNINNFKIKFLKYFLKNWILKRKFESQILGYANKPEFRKYFENKILCGKNLQNKNKNKWKEKKTEKTNHDHKSCHIISIYKTKKINQKR